jgi:hypothetical protein
MSAKITPPCSSLSFFECVSWISFFIAILMAVIVGAICLLPLFDGNDLLDAYIFVFGGLVIVLVLGVISLIGFRHHRRPITLWLALAGVLISGGLAFGEVTFIISILRGFGHQ